MATDSNTITVADWLKQSTLAIHQTGSDSAKIDAQLLLCHVLGKDRTWLFTWSDTELDAAQLQQAATLLQRRLDGEPIAYILGYREFWSLTLATEPSTLIPRADTETLVEWALELPLGPKAEVLDLGTGTGAIALALASENPGWNVQGVDLQAGAVALASRNARDNHLSHVTFCQSSWFEQVSGQFDLIVSNPPYIDPEDHHLDEGDVRFEPRSALIADEQGLADLRHIVDQSRLYLNGDGWLLVEHGYDQQAAVTELFRQAGYLDVATREDLGGNPRITGGRWPARQLA